MIIAKLFLICTTVLGGSVNWRGFLGPVDKELNDASLPLEWDSQKHIAWTATLAGYGQSSPVVWQDRIFVTTVDGKQKETGHVIALSGETGKQLWDYSFATSSGAENNDYVSRAAPSPIADADGVVAFFESGNLIALDNAGKVVWQRDLVAEYGEIKSRHGLAGSLAQYQSQDANRLFVWIARDSEPYLLAFDRQTGTTAWKIDTAVAATWSSPVILTHSDGSAHVVLSSSGTLTGYSTADGSQQWKLEGLAGNTTPTPQPVVDLAKDPKAVVDLAKDPKGEVDLAKDPKASTSSPSMLLLGASSGRDGGSTRESAQSNGLLSIAKEGEKWQPKFLWRCDKATCSFNSPLMHNGYAYFVNRQGVLFCIDAATGKEVYAERIGHSVWATPVAVGSRLYCVGDSNITTVVQAGPEFKVLAKNELWPAEAPAAAPAGAEGSVPPPGMVTRPRQYAVALLPGQILIRRGDRLYSIVKP